MNEVIGSLLVLLLVVNAVGFFIAGLAMLLMRPARIDPDTGAPSLVWRACCGLMFATSASHVRGVYVTQTYNTEDLYGVSVRLVVSAALAFVLYALWCRHRLLTSTGMDADAIERTRRTRA